MQDNENKVVAVIPARLESTRLPRKVLLPIGGIPLIQYIHNNIMKADLVEDIYVATDSEEIKEVVDSFGGKVIITPSEGIYSGSDRIAHALPSLPHDIIVNVQGDEPFMTGPMIDETIKPMLDEPSLKACTLCRQITRREEFDDPGFVKCVWDVNGYGLYFSRQRIPYPRKKEGYKIYEHLGIYAFRREFLQTFVEWGPTPLEMTEGLEMLRIIEHGEKLKVIQTKEDTTYYLSVDTKADLEKANKYHEILQLF